MHIVFPWATADGISLLRARRAVLEWSQRRNVHYQEHYDDGYTITLTSGSDYTLFALEWELPPAYVVPEIFIT